MKDLIVNAGFRISKCGEISNDKLKDFKLSLNSFFSKKDDPQYDSFLIKSFEIEGHDSYTNLLFLEYEEIIEKLISNL